MILADKIIALRKKAGWSQEELGEKLGVTRQSVSKWEGAQSVPDMDKILQLSRLFGVTTDYLLKDELGEPEYTAEESSVPALHRVSMEEASEYAPGSGPKNGSGNAVMRDMPRGAAGAGRTQRWEDDRAFRKRSGWDWLVCTHVIGSNRSRDVPFLLRQGQRV